MKINVVENIIKGDMVSITFDIRSNGERKQMRIKDVRYASNPKTKEQRDHKKRQQAFLEELKSKMIFDELYRDFFFEKGFDQKKNFFEFTADYIKRKSALLDIRSYSAVVDDFKKWAGKDSMPCGNITESMISEFRDYLDTKHKGITPYDYFKKLKRIFKEATVAKHFKTNPAQNVVNKKGQTSQKDTLTMDDIKTLASTDCSNKELKNAFIFCCLIGLRFCDVKTLKWENIKDGCIDVVQSKTKKRLVLPLSSDTEKLIGTPKESTALIFKLPSHTGCLKLLKNWVKASGIKKHITFHCARHSCGTNLLEYKVDPFTISKLLGHSSIHQTQIYMRVSESKKLGAINALPSIF